MSKYTREQLSREYERIERDYVRLDEHSKIKIIEEIYGPKANSTFVPRMRKVYERYQAHLKTQDPSNPIFELPAELWTELCKICDPAFGAQPTSVQADPLPMEDLEERLLSRERQAGEEQAAALALARAEKEAAQGYDVGRCVAAMRAAVDGLSEADARAAAEACERLGWRTAELAADDWKAISGCEGREKRRVIVDALAEYLDSIDTAPARA